MDNCAEMSRQLLTLHAVTYPLPIAQCNFAGDAFKDNFYAVNHFRADYTHNPVNERNISPIDRKLIVSD